MNSFSRHSTHADEPAGAANPVLQAVQTPTSDAATASLDVPIGQGVHKVAAPGAYVPATQSVHSVAPSFAEVPGAHGEHEEA